MSICKDCFHSYVCEQFNEQRECDNKKCHFANDHFISADQINRLQSENERLTKENTILSQNADTAFQDGLNEAQDLYAEQVKAEIKAEAYKEFWNSRPERLNEKCKGREEYNKGWNACLDEFWEIRNNFLKEMEGEDK